MSLSRYHKFKFIDSNAIAEELIIPEGIWRIAMLSIGLSAAPVGADPFTITLDSEDGADYDALIHSEDLDGDISFFWDTIPEVLLYGGDARNDGDKLDLAMTNDDSRTVGVRLVIVKVGDRPH